MSNASKSGPIRPKPAHRPDWITVLVDLDPDGKRVTFRPTPAFHPTLKTPLLIERSTLQPTADGDHRPSAPVLAQAPAAALYPAGGAPELSLILSEQPLLQGA